MENLKEHKEASEQAVQDYINKVAQDVADDVCHSRRCINVENGNTCANACHYWLNDFKIAHNALKMCFSDIEEGKLKDIINNLT